jgi:hypothetical protein
MAGDHVLAEAAGITGGYWYASPATHVGHELIAAGMLILAGVMDSRWTMTSWNAGHASATSGGNEVTARARGSHSCGNTLARRE